jgi:hypothetical protein
MLKIALPSPMFMVMCLSMATFCVALESQTVVVVKIQKQSQDPPTTSEALNLFLEVYFKSMNGEKELTTEEEMNEEVLKKFFVKVEGYGEGKFGTMTDGDFRLRSFFNVKENIAERMLEFDDDLDIGFKYSKKEDPLFQECFSKLDAFSNFFKFKNNNYFMKILSSEKTKEDTQTIIFSFKSNSTFLLPILAQETKESLKNAFDMSKSLFSSDLKQKSMKLNQDYPIYFYLKMVNPLDYFESRNIIFNCQANYGSLTFYENLKSVNSVTKKIEFRYISQMKEKICITSNLVKASVVHGSILKKTKTAKTANTACYECGEAKLDSFNIFVVKLADNFTRFARLTDILINEESVFSTDIRSYAITGESFTFRISPNEFKEYEFEAIPSDENRDKIITIKNAIDLKKEDLENFKKFFNKFENFSIKIREMEETERTAALEEIKRKYLTEAHFDLKDIHDRDDVIHPFKNELEYHFYNFLISPKARDYNRFLFNLNQKLNDQESFQMSENEDFFKKYFPNGNKKQLIGELSKSSHIDYLLKMIDSHSLPMNNREDFQNYIKYVVRIFNLYSDIYQERYHDFLTETEEKVHQRFDIYKKEIEKISLKTEIDNKPNGKPLEFEVDPKVTNENNFKETLDLFIKKHSAPGKIFNDSTALQKNREKAINNIVTICKTLIDESSIEKDSINLPFLKDFKLFSVILPTLIGLESEMQLIEETYWNELAIEFSKSIDFFCKIFGFEVENHKNFLIKVKKNFQTISNKEVVLFLKAMLEEFLNDNNKTEENDCLKELTDFKRRFDLPNLSSLDFSQIPYALKLTNSLINTKYRKEKYDDIKQLEISFDEQKAKSPLEPHERFQRIEGWNNNWKFVNDEGEKLPFFFECRSELKKKECLLREKLELRYLEDVEYITHTTGVKFVQEELPDPQKQNTLIRRLLLI